MPQVFPAIVETTREKIVNYEEDEFWKLIELTLLEQHNYIIRERKKKAKR